MKSIIFYRSSYKGNTLKIAQSMSDALSAELVPIDNAPQICLSDYESDLDPLLTLQLTTFSFRDMYQGLISRVKIYLYFPLVAVLS